METLDTQGKVVMIEENDTYVMVQLEWQQSLRVKSGKVRQILKTSRFSILMEPCEDPPQEGWNETFSDVKVGKTIRVTSFRKRVRGRDYWNVYSRLELMKDGIPERYKESENDKT